MTIDLYFQMQNPTQCSGDISVCLFILLSLLGQFDAVVLRNWQNMHIERSCFCPNQESWALISSLHSSDVDFSRNFVDQMCPFFYGRGGQNCEIITLHSPQISQEFQRLPGIPKNLQVPTGISMNL